MKLCVSSILDQWSSDVESVLAYFRYVGCCNTHFCLSWEGLVTLNMLYLILIQSSLQWLSCIIELFVCRSIGYTLWHLLLLLLGLLFIQCTYSTFFLEIFRIAAWYILKSLDIVFLLAWSLISFLVLWILNFSKKT